MGNTCKPMVVSFQCMTKSTTIKKKKKRIESVCPCQNIHTEWSTEVLLIITKEGK